jgi:tetratricopeptide (TPR) repeat protein
MQQTSSLEGRLPILQSLLLQSEQLYSRGMYEEAKLILTKVLLEIEKAGTPLENFKSTHIHCFTVRGKCRLAMGDGQGALQDAEDALKLSSGTNLEALLCKAEAYYISGNFEQALIVFNKGCRLKPESPEFQLGFEKSVDVIRKAVDSVNVDHLKIWRNRVKREEASTPIQTQPPGSPKKTKPVKITMKQQNASSRMLLDELAEDYRFLEELSNDTTMKHDSLADVKHMVDESLNYLDNRIEFWRQRHSKAH